MQLAARLLVGDANWIIPLLGVFSPTFWLLLPAGKVVEANGTGMKEHLRVVRAQSRLRCDANTDVFRAGFHLNPSCHTERWKAYSTSSLSLRSPSWVGGWPFRVGPANAAKLK